MKTLEHQLADYGERQREIHGPITTAELTGRLNQVDLLGPVQPLRPVTQTARFRPTRQWPVAVMAAAVVLLCVGAAALLFRVARPEPPVATTPTIESSSSTWSRVAYSEAIFGEGFEQVMDSVTVGGPGFAAVGQSGGRAAVWTSVDGLAWSQVPDDKGVFGGGVMHSVTAAGPGLVAVGTSDQAAVWTSPDGFTWSRVSDNEAFSGTGGRYAAMNSVVAGGPGVVAVGIDGHPHGTNVNPVVWTSPDGIAWSRIPHSEAVFGSNEGVHWTEMQDVTVGGPGLVAVGADWRGTDGQGGAAVWTSVDGITWSRVPPNEAVFEGAMTSVTAGGPGLVAVGGGAAGAAVWTSVDGVTWSRIPHNETVFGEASMFSVTAGGPGLVAVGQSGGHAAVWTSPDGIAWTRVPHDDAVFTTQDPELPALEMRSVTANASRLVAVGTNTQHPTAGATRSDAAVWVATAKD